MAHFVLFDDDPTFGSMFSKALLKHGLKCSPFDRVEAFLESGQERPDLFIVDLSMPDPSGVHWEFGGILNVSKIRQAFGDDVPIWVLTGYDDVRIERECVRSGANKMLFKREGVAETANDLSIHWLWRETGNRRRFH